MIVIIEGLDKSGKSTQCQLLKDRLIKENYKVELYREPGSTDIGELIRNNILKANIDINPLAQLFLFETCRNLLCEKLLKENNDKELYGKDKIIILDRFIASSYAYQGAQLKVNDNLLNHFLNQVNQINSIASYALKPQLSLFLELSLETIESRMDDKSKEDMFEKHGKKFLKSVRKLYQKYIMENDINEHWEMLDCNDKKPEQVHEEVYLLVMNQYQKINI